MFFYGIRHLTERQDLVQDAAVLRSESAETLRLSVSAGPDGQVVLEWPSHPEADRYRIEIVRSEHVRGERCLVHVDGACIQAATSPPGV